MNTISKNVKIKNQFTIVADTIEEINKKIKEITYYLSTNEEAIVAKKIVAYITVLEIT